ncbi:MAG TPA: hydroxysqualene dehydroxylase HpnE [Acidobacteriaceae bacterium]|nr:hydroxysqualene dehydroxylase HpnE [Acidobacteriaceae bacterium]
MSGNLAAGAAADVIVVGAGVAGLAAAVALSGVGARVVLLERKPYVGGRAYSYLHPALNEVIDSQHVLLGCCTNLIDLCRLAGVERKIRWYDAIPFLEPARNGGEARRSEIVPGGLPAPAHSAMSFLGAPMLSARDKAGIARGLMEFMRGIPGADDEAFSEWVKRTGQTQGAVKHFWEPIIVSTLNDTFERTSTRYAAKVIYVSLLKSAEGGRLGVPAEPLSEFYAAMAELAARQGAEVRLRASVERIERVGDVWRATMSDGAVVSAKAIVLALPFEQVQRLLATIAEPSAEQRTMMEGFAHFVHSPITTIHLWLDREVTEIEQAALLDTRIQWMFNKSRIRRSGAGEHYYELVISASHAELKKTREEILTSGIEEFRRFFPAMRAAKVLRAGVLKEARATFSVTPGLERFRPEADACGDGLYLAGDWTKTDWPSTMESAARSGRMAAERVARAAGGKQQFLTPELPVRGLMRMLAR